MVVFKKNATKEKAKKVWVSFGIIRNLKKFMDAKEMVFLQSANKFCYDIAVSRVQQSLWTEPAVFAWPGGGDLETKIVSFRGARAIKTTEQSLDFRGWKSVQIDRKLLFQIYVDSTQCRMIEGGQSDQFTSKLLAPPPSYNRDLDDSTLFDSSICLVNANFIYLTGGFDEHNVFAICHRYDIERNMWQEMADMSSPRQGHSSCQLGEHIYVFCGYDIQDNVFNQVEKLSITDDPKQQVYFRWEVIPLKNLSALPEQHLPLSIAINSHEIIILGGCNYDEGIIQLFDTRTDIATSVAVAGAFEFSNPHGTYLMNGTGQPIALCGPNKVVALVQNWTAGGKPCLIQYVRDTNTISVLKQWER